MNGFTMTMEQVQDEAPRDGREHPRRDGWWCVIQSGSARSEHWVGSHPDAALMRSTRLLIEHTKPRIEMR